MSNPESSQRSARGDAEIVIAPDGSVIIFDLDLGLLPAAEALSPGDPKLAHLRKALQQSPESPEPKPPAASS